MKARELRELSREELLTELVTQREALFRLRVRGTTGEAAAPSEFTRVRRDIARLLTVLRERELSQVAEVSATDQGAEAAPGDRAV